MDTGVRVRGDPLIAGDPVIADILLARTAGRTGRIGDARRTRGPLGAAGSLGQPVGHRAEPLVELSRGVRAVTKSVGGSSAGV